MDTFELFNNGKLVLPEKRLALQGLNGQSIRLLRVSN